MGGVIYYFKTFSALIRVTLVFLKKNCLSVKKNRFELTKFYSNFEKTKPASRLIIKQYVMKKFLPKNCEFYKFFRCFSVNVRLEPLSFLLCLSNSILFVRSVYQANHKNQHPYDKNYEKAFTPMLMRTFRK